jgi:alpha-L-fucosidase
VLTEWAVDPFSYGYNAATPTDNYMNASTVVTSLVDIVSKNGNYLLDIGPLTNGSIQETEAQHLREAGAWIKDHAEAVFNTIYWFVAPQEGADVRYTTTVDAFYVLVMNQINGTLTLTSPIPWIEGDQVTVVGGSAHGEVVPSRAVTVDDQTGVLFEISDEVQAADKWTWVLKISYD